jgi:hypothetical protein
MGAKFHELHSRLDNLSLSPALLQYKQYSLGKGLLHEEGQCVNISDRERAGSCNE